MLSDRAILEFPPADVDGDGNNEQGTFVFAGNLTITPSFRTGFLIGGRGSRINNVLQQVASGESTQGKGFYLDLGEGAHTIEIEFQSWEGAQDANGNPLQWGDSGDPTSKTATDMTGEKALSQINCLEKYLGSVSVDSTATATLEYGEFSTSGVYSPLDVVIEGPTMTRAGQDGEWFDGSMTLIEAQAFDEVLSATERTAE